MTINGGVISLIRRFLTLIVTLFRRIICWRKKHRRNSGTLLPIFDSSSSNKPRVPDNPYQYQNNFSSSNVPSPVTLSTTVTGQIPVSSSAEYTSSSKQGYNASYSFDSYASANHVLYNPHSSQFSSHGYKPSLSNAQCVPNLSKSSVPTVTAGPSSDQSFGLGNSQVQAQSVDSTTKHQNPEEDENVDFFKDMAPTLKRPKKVYVSRLQNPEANSNSVSSPISASVPTSSRPFVDRFSVDPSASFEVSPELGIIDDSVTGRVSSWEDDTYAADELGMSLEESLSAARHNERMRRLAEHKRLALEREQRKAKSSKSNFMATKLS